MTARKPSKRKPRITREQAIEQAVRRWTLTAVRESIAFNATKVSLPYLEGCWPWTVRQIRREFARLTQ